MATQAEVVYNYLVTRFGDEWDTYKDEFQDSLARTGVNGKGVFMDFPIVLSDFPAVGILLGNEAYARADNDYGLNQDLIFRILLYCYRADTPTAMNEIQRMRNVALKIVMSDPTLGGTVHQTEPVGCEYGVLSEAIYMPGEIKVIGCAMNVTAKIFAEQII